MKNYPRCFRLSLAIIFSLFAALPQSVQAAQMSDSGGSIVPINKTDVPSKRTSFPLSDVGKNVAAREDSGSDHAATVFETQGEVRVLKQGAEDWQEAEKGMILEVGDKIITGEDSRIDIAYDAHFLNVARIESNAKAEFRSIEPTDLFLEDGTVFNALDGLNGAEYQVATPTAVAGVRGTTFDMTYNSSTKESSMNVFPDQSSHLGEIIVKQDNREINLTEGEGFSGGEIIDIPAETLDKANQFMEQIDKSFAEERQEGFGQLEVSAGETREAPSESRREESEKVVDGPNDGNGPQGQTRFSEFGEDGLLKAETLPEAVIEKDVQVDVDRIVDKALDILPDVKPRPAELARTEVFRNVPEKTAARLEKSTFVMEKFEKNENVREALKEAVGKRTEISVGGKIGNESGGGGGEVQRTVAEENKQETILVLEEKESGGSSLNVS